MAAIEELAADMDRDEVIASVEHAAGLAVSATAGRTLRVRLDSETGGLLCFAMKRVAAEVLDPESEIETGAAPEGATPGDMVEVPAPLGVSRRSAVRAARAVLEARVGAAWRLARAARYRDRIGKLETGIVARREGEDLIVNLGPVEGRLPASEQSRHEVFNPEDTIRAAVRAVEPEDPPVILSRIAPEVLAGVIERETPEVRRGEVEVRAAARHPGVRAKVAVWTEARGVDPVAACLGPGGVRIRAVSRELRGERVDVILWHPEIETFAKNALRPAEVLAVEPLPTGPDGRTGPAGRAGSDERRPVRGRERQSTGLLATVSEAELPRAVGKRGQNVRLASELVGLPIEVVAEGQPVRLRPRREGPREGPEPRRDRDPRRDRGPGRRRSPGGSRGPGSNRGPRRTPRQREPGARRERSGA